MKDLLREYQGYENKKRKIEREEIEEDDLIDAKLRQVFGPIGKTFDYAKKRVTDLDENSKVWLQIQIQRAVWRPPA